MRRTRRAFLAGGGAALAGLAGCLGGGSDSGSGSDGGPTPTPVSELPRPVIGDEEAAVTVQAYEDFACPHCATYSLDVFPKLRREYVETGDVRYEFYDFPIPVSEQWSWGAAVAARAVQALSDAPTFFEYGHDLFDNQGSYSLSLLADLAEEYGVDGAAVRDAVEYGVYRPVVEADRQTAVDRGFQGTPTIVVDGSQVTPTYEAISDAIDARL